MGATDAQWATADSNAWTLISELIDQCVEDQTINGACEWARVTDWASVPSTTDDGTVTVDVTFTITVRDFG